jgi:three-Cys-motif partner protein
MNTIGDDYVWGSPLIALRAEPAFTKCVMVEYGEWNYRALKARTASYGDRAVSTKGDVNVDLLPLMRNNIPRWAPCVCVLDPEGTEVAWSTIERLAAFRRGKYKIELLLLFDADGLVRVMPNLLDVHSLSAMNRVFGNRDWVELLLRRHPGDLDTPQKVQFALVRMYRDQLLNLGYEKVIARPIKRDSRTGPVQYYLVFATDSAAGEKIMTHCFETVFQPEPGFVTPWLPGLEPPPELHR